MVIGESIGVYRVVAKIGEGGMREVYRATDTNLKRQVAIKVLPESVAADTERLGRFQREAEVLAQLNHPNIAHIHGFERDDGHMALVMELVEGPTLADRIARGALPVDEALPIARQIANALEAAHEQGIIHRDLKPANIKVRDDGTAKVLDFGLAKSMNAPGVTVPRDFSQLPTATTPAITQEGGVLGTPAYMSPEQARGRPTDKRADVWSFGCVLFEMLVGRPAFSVPQPPTPWWPFSSANQHGICCCGDSCQRPAIAETVSGEGCADAAARHRGCTARDRGSAARSGSGRRTGSGPIDVSWTIRMAGRDGGRGHGRGRGLGCFAVRRSGTARANGRVRDSAPDQRRRTYQHACALTRSAPVRTGLFDLPQMKGPEVAPERWTPSGVLFSMRNDLWSAALTANGRVSGAPRRLTTGVGPHVQPVAGPNGEIVFTQVVQERVIEQASVANVEEPPVRLYADAGSNTWRASITMDGSRLVLERLASTAREVWIKDTGSGRQALVVRVPTMDPLNATVSPDGARISYTQDSAGTASPTSVGFVVETSGGVPRKLCDGCGLHGFLSDNQHVLAELTDGHAIRLIDARTGQGRDLVTAAKGGRLDRPHVSPDNRWLAFREGGGDTRARTFVIRLPTDRPALVGGLTAIDCDDDRQARWLVAGFTRALSAPRQRWLSLPLGATNRPSHWRAGGTAIRCPPLSFQDRHQHQLW